MLPLFVETTSTSMTCMHSMWRRTPGVNWRPLARRRHPAQVRGSSKMVASFTSVYTGYTAGRGSMVVVCFLKMLIMMHCICLRGI